jgi:hypothetical protein
MFAPSVAGSRRIIACIHLLHHALVPNDLPTTEMRIFRDLQTAQEYLIVDHPHKPAVFEDSFGRFNPSGSFS